MAETAFGRVRKSGSWRYRTPYAYATVTSRAAASTTRSDCGTNADSRSPHARRIATRDPILRRHALAELRKTRRGIIALAATLADGVHPDDYTHWGKPGIRAQLYDIRRNALEMDFVLEGDERSLHILNAVSPGFTCAMPFAEYVVDRVEQTR